MDIFGFLKTHKITFEENVPLSKKTWIKTGGICAYWIVPESIEQLTRVCKFLYSSKIAFALVGQTSNIFFHNTYHPEVVISTIGVKNYQIKDNILIADCGVSVARMAKECLAKGYTGFYGLIGLPGTVAAAVCNNASCFDCSITSMLISVDCLMSDGSVRTLRKEELGFRHRSSAFKRKEIQGVVLSVKLRLEKAADEAEEQRKSEEAVRYRHEKQEKPHLNLGSVFASRTMRTNARNILVFFLTRCLSVLGIIKDKRRFQKRLMLSMYGYGELNPYISDKNINTFIWQDEQAERMFNLYKQFMGKVYKDLILEIEEKR